MLADFLRAVDDTGNNVQAHQLGEIEGDIENGFTHADDTDAVVAPRCDIGCVVDSALAFGMAVRSDVDRR